MAQLAQENVEEMHKLTPMILSLLEAMMIFLLVENCNDERGIFFLSFFVDYCYV